MKKQVFYIFLLNILITSSCMNIQNSRTALLNSSNSEQLADTHLEQILDGLESKDRELIKSLFSKQALSEVDDINVGIDYLFDFFQGEVVFWYKDGAPAESQEYVDGNRTNNLRVLYYVETNMDNYIIYFMEYTEDTGNPKNIGVYTLRVIKEEDKETELGYWPDMKIPGIYIPDDK